MDMINVKINGIAVSVPKGSTVQMPLVQQVLKFPHFAL